MKSFLINLDNNITIIILFFNFFSCNLLYYNKQLYQIYFLLNFGYTFFIFKIKYISDLINLMQASACFRNNLYYMRVKNTLHNTKGV